jgi:hypothetical protein
VANTQITGNIISSQISPSVTLNGNTTIASGNLTVGELVRTSANGFQSGNITDSFAKFVYDGGSAALDITNQYNSGGAGSTYGQIVFKNYNSSGGSLTERVRITGSGNILAQKCISVGAATPSSDGAGITFPATQSASSDANTLDDYEEGTWTPTFTAASGTLAGFSSSGLYTKIGRTVNIVGKVSCSGIGSASGQMTVGNFPFPAQMSLGAMGFFITEWYQATLATETFATVRFEGSSTTCSIVGFNLSGSGDLRLNASGINSGSGLYLTFCGTYTV